MGCLLELLPDDIIRIIVDYKEEMESVERFLLFLDCIMQNMLFF